MIRTLLRPPAGLACIVLAAGGSRRLGQPKQLLRQRGRTLLLRQVTLARQFSRQPPVVVIGASHLRMRRALRQLRPGVTVIRNPDWHQGMAGSLRTGLALLRPDVRAVLVCLVDQPLVRREDLQQLALAWQCHRSRVIAAEYNDRLGAPAIIPRTMFRRIRKLNGDRGAAQLFRNQPSTVRIPMPAAAADIDTREDLRRYLRPGNRA